MKMSKTRRIYVGGLFEGATSEDLQTRFAKYGKIDGVEIRSKKDASGQVYKTFGYMNISCDDTSFQKCVRTFHNSKWKGNILQIQEAKTSHLEKLQNEVKGATEASKSFKEEKQSSENRTNSHGDQGSSGKYRTELPVLNIQQNDKRKVLTINPNDNSRRIKKFDSDDDDEDYSGPITWNIPEQETSKVKETDSNKSQTLNTTKSSSSKQSPYKNKKTKIQKIAPKDADRGDDSSDSDSKALPPKKVKSETRIVKETTTPQKQFNHNANENEFEVVSSHKKIGRANATLKRSRFDSSNDEDDDVQVVKQTKKPSKKKLKDTPKQPATISNVTPNKVANGPVLNDNKTKVDKRNRKQNSTNDSFSTKPAKVNSDSESDVPDIESWIYKPKKKAGSDRKQGVQGVDRKQKEPSNKKITEGKLNQQASTPLADEFSAGLSAPSITQAPPAPRRSKSIGDDDRADDSDDAGDLLDAVSAKDWKSVQRFEKQAQQGKGKEKKGKKKASDKAPTDTKPVDDSSTSKKGKGEKPKNADGKKKTFMNAFEKKKQADAKRLEALQEKKQESQRHSNLIKAALASVDGKDKKNKIVFDSDDDENDDVPIDFSATVEPEREETKKSGIALFNEGDSDSSGDDENAFAIREQFEGKSGRKLMKLQARIGTADDRFKMDARFAKDADDSSSDSSSDEEEEASAATEATDADQERKKNMAILQGVVGHTVEKTKKKKEFKDMTSMRYDPTREDHQQFEVKPDDSKKSEKKKKKDKHHLEKDEKVEELPVVSSDKFVNVTDSLQGSFKSTASASNDQPFSLLSMFGDEGQSQSKPSQDSKQATTLRKKAMPWEQDKPDTFSDDDAKPAAKISGTDKPNGSLFSSSVETFFFVPGDSRLKEGLEFFNDKDLLSYNEWPTKRQELVEAYRASHRKALRVVKEKQELAEQLRSRAQRQRGGHKGFKRGGGPKNYRNNRMQHKNHGQRRP